MDRKALKHKFLNQRIHAKIRGHGWELTEEQWVQWWKDSGHLHERGSKAHQYCMARINDEGPYALGNIKCITMRENAAEMRHKKATIEKLRKHALENNANSHPCEYAGIEYRSISAAARAHNVSWLTMKRWLQKDGGPAQT